MTALDIAKMNSNQEGCNQEGCKRCVAVLEVSAR